MDEDSSSSSSGGSNIGGLLIIAIAGFLIIMGVKGTYHNLFPGIFGSAPVDSSSTGKAPPPAGTIIDCTGGKCPSGYSCVGGKCIPSVTPVNGQCPAGTFPLGPLCFPVPFQPNPATGICPNGINIGGVCVPI